MKSFRAENIQRVKLRQRKEQSGDKDERKRKKTQTQMHEGNKGLRFKNTTVVRQTEAHAPASPVADCCDHCNYF